MHLRSYGTALPFQETPNVSSPYFLRTQRFNAFAGHSFLANQIHGRFMSSASIELKTDSTVVRFSISKQHDKNGSSEKGKKTTKRVKMSRKAKLNELRFYRLKAKKKMNSPNPEVRIRYKLEKVCLLILIIHVYSCLILLNVTKIAIRFQILHCWFLYCICAHFMEIQTLIENLFKIPAMREQ